MHLPFRRVVYSLGLALALVSLLAACGTPTTGTQTGAGGTGGTGLTGGTSEVGGNQGQAGGGVAVLPTSTTGSAGNAPLGGTAAVGTESAGGTTGAGNMAPVPPGQLDPCRLLTKSDVESAVGTTVNEPTRSADQNNVLSCNYTSSGTAATTVNFSLFQGVDQIQIAQQNLSQTTNQAVTGVGDQAVQTANGLLVKSGDLFFNIQVVLANQPDQNNDVAKQLATLVVQNLASATPAAPTEAATP